ncbi:MAG: SIR2 family protein [Elusimicrobia bacterium]|nr:SIR2 family protein [Elusimicrobiota bacterium]
MGAPFHRNILLVGAGFSKDFGGLLSSELWAKLFNHPDVQASPKLQKTMKESRFGFNFEKIYAHLREEERRLLPPFSEAISDVFLEMDTEFRSEKYRSGISLSYLFAWLREFVGTRSAPGFIFSLNQDLLFERLSGDGFLPHLPCVPGRAQAREVESTRTVGAVQIPLYGTFPRLDSELRACNLIKLHGSCNWTSTGKKSERILILGDSRAKATQIMYGQFLHSYYLLMREVLERRGGTLWIVGYGFNDAHVNDNISRGIQKGGLRVFIVCPERPDQFFRQLPAKPAGCSILTGVAGYFPYSVREMFPAGGSPARAYAETMSLLRPGVER